MTDLRKAAKQAAKELKELIHWYGIRYSNDKLVPAHNQPPEIKSAIESLAELRQALAQPDEVLAEREACALIVEHKQVPLNWNDRECFAKAIRARGNK